MDAQDACTPPSALPAATSPPPSTSSSAPAAPKPPGPAQEPGGATAWRNPSAAIDA